MKRIERLAGISVEVAQAIQEPMNGFSALLAGVERKS
jgi:hypothetical protein